MLTLGGSRPWSLERSGAGQSPDEIRQQKQMALAVLTRWQQLSPPPGQRNGRPESADMLPIDQMVRVV